MGVLTVGSLLLSNSLMSFGTSYLALLTSLTSLATLFFAYAYYHQKVLFKQLSSLPGPRDVLNIPFSGTLSIGLDLLRQLTFTHPLDTMMHRFLCQMSTKHRDSGLFHLHRIFTPLVFVFRADHVEQVLSHSTNIRKGELYNTFIPWLRRGLLTSDGAKWKARRRQLNPVFHYRNLDNYNEIINEQALRFADVLSKRTKDQADIVPYVNKLSLDLISSTILGVPMDSLLGADGAEYLQSVSDFSRIILTRGVFPHEWNMSTFRLLPKARKHDELLKKLWGFTANIIEERKQILLKEQEANKGKKMPETPDKCRPLLDILLDLHLQDPQSMTTLNIQEEVDTFTFSGHDTTALGLMFCMFLIGCYPDVQEKIQQEIDCVFADDRDAPVTAEKLKELKYLDIVIKECHRVLPPVALIGRVLDEDMVFNNNPVPKGTHVFIHIYSLHRDPEVFANPEKFDPDRFLPENAAGRNAFAYVPFSAGPRSCIGQRYARMVEKVVITQILKNHNMVSLERKEDLELVQDIVLHSKNGLKTMIVPRTTPVS